MIIVEMYFIVACVFFVVVVVFCIVSINENIEPSERSRHLFFKYWSTKFIGKFNIKLDVDNEKMTYCIFG